MLTDSTSPNEKEFIQKFTKGVLPYFIDKSNNNIVICVLLHRKGEISHLKLADKIFEPS